MQTTSTSITIIAAAVAGLFATTPLHAAEEPAKEAAKTEELTPAYADTTLSSDWGGGRSRLAKDGLVFEGLLRYDTLKNKGALSNGTRGVSHVDIKLKADLETLWGWKGSTAMLNVLSDSGNGPNTRHVGSLMGVTNLEVSAPTTTRLFQAWVQQALFDDRLSVLAGIYPIDSEFFTVDSAAVFIKPEYGPPAEMSTTRGLSIFNNAAFGIRTKVQSSDKSLYAMWALMDGIPNDPAHPKRTVIKFAKGDGAFNIGEIGWLPEAANDKVEGHAKLAIGVWAYTSRVNDLVDVDAAGNPLQRRSHGAYVLAEKTLVRLGDDGTRYITGFARHGWTDGDSTSLKNSVNLGLHVKGPVASRADDIIGLAWTRAGVGNKWRTTQLPTPIASSEEALEVTYRYAVTPWFAVQPNIQRVRHPGGRADLPNAKLIGARLELAL